MGLTPSEILHKEFDTKFRGYDPDQVNDFLDVIVAEFEKLIEENQQMSSKIDTMQDKLNYFQQLQDSLNNSIVIAQEAADRLKQNARKEAELILYEAENEADNIVSEAETKVRSLTSQNEAIRQSTMDYKQRLMALIESQLEVIHRPDFEEMFRPAVDSSDQEAISFEELNRNERQIPTESTSEAVADSTQEMTVEQAVETEPVSYNHVQQETIEQLTESDELETTKIVEDLDLSFSPEELNEAQSAKGPESIFGRTIRIDLPDSQ